MDYQFNADAQRIGELSSEVRELKARVLELEKGQAYTDGLLKVERDVVYKRNRS